MNSWTVLKMEVEISPKTSVINYQSNVLIIHNTLITFSKKLMKTLNLGNNLLSKKMLPSASPLVAWVCSFPSVSQWTLSYLRVIYTGFPCKPMNAIDYSGWHTYIILGSGVLLCFICISSVVIYNNYQTITH
jgi:hypothetical protein